MLHRISFVPECKYSSTRIHVAGNMVRFDDLLPFPISCWCTPVYSSFHPLPRYEGTREANRQSGVKRANISRARMSSSW